MKPALPWFLRSAGRGLSTGRLFLFTLPFLAGGIVVFWGMTGRAGTDWWRGRSWEPAEAVIQRACLDNSDDCDGDSYKVAVEYTYTYRGRRHQGTRPSFVHNATNVGVNGMRETVRQLPPGKKAACWVNPANPAEAVLDRSLPVEAVVGFFFSLPFLAVGAFGLCIPALPWLRGRFRQRRLEQLLPEIHSGSLPSWLPDLFKHSGGAEEGRTALVIAQDERLSGALGLTFVNVFWNGIVAVFVCVAIISFATGETAVGVLLSLFLTPFIAIGAGIVWKGVKQWRLVRRPRWVAVVRPVPDLAGGEVALSWAWLDARRVSQCPEADIRLVALAAAWDAESDSPGETLSGRRRVRVFDAAATRKGELELAAVEIPSSDQPQGQVKVHLLPLASPQAWLEAQAARKKEKLGQTIWGGWWEIEVTYPDGEMETVKLTEPVKLK